MEEARTFCFNNIGLAYVETERLGLMAPMTDIRLKYKRPARYGDTFTVRLRVTEYTGVRYRIAYTILNQEGDILVEAESGQAFVGSDYKPVSLAHAAPERHELMKKILQEGMGTP